MACAIMHRYMGVAGCWCAPRSSKPVRGASNLPGGFDSHIFPPNALCHKAEGIDFMHNNVELLSYIFTKIYLAFLHFDHEPKSHLLFLLKNIKKKQIFVVFFPIYTFPNRYAKYNFIFFSFVKSMIEKLCLIFCGKCGLIYPWIVGSYGPVRELHNGGRWVQERSHYAAPKE